MLKRLAGIFAALSAVAVVGAAVLGFVVWQAWQPAPTDDDIVVNVPRGIGVGTIGDLLAAEGVVPSRWHFMVWSRALVDDRPLKAGEYRLAAGITGAEIIEIMREGRVVSYRITIPEGFTSREVVDLLLAEDRLTGELETVPAEGTVLPETYSFVRGDRRQDLLERMKSEMTGLVEDLWEDRAENLPLDSPHEAVTLASIIEKETGVAGERDIVASVFVNRLWRGMPLQSDPTVIFALTEGEEPLGRPLYRSDWEVDHPYNTYRINGLPPGPIANPGVDSLRAALNPAHTDYLYFVADGTGGHAFARTLDAHNRNVAAWRRIRDAN